MKFQTFVKSASAVAVAFTVFGLGTAYAGTLYDNTVGALTPGYATNGYQISGSDSVTDSFSLTQSSILTGVDFVVWTLPGDIPTGVNWAIETGTINGTTGVLTGATVYSGTASLSGGPATGFTPNSFGYDVSLEAFSLSNLSLAAGSYWLQLSSVTGTGTDPVYWDENNGPSFAYGAGADDPGNLAGVDSSCCTGSETFQVLGNPQQTGGQTPEPGTAALLGTGLMLAGLLRRKLS